MSGVPQSIDSGRTTGKRFLPVDRHQHRRRAAEQRALLLVVDRTDVADERAVDARRDVRVEVRALVLER